MNVCKMFSAHILLAGMLLSADMPQSVQSVFVFEQHIQSGGLFLSQWAVRNQANCIEDQTFTTGQNPSCARPCIENLDM